MLTDSVVAQRQLHGGAFRQALLEFLTHPSSTALHSGKRFSFDATVRCTYGNRTLGVSVNAGFENDRLEKALTPAMVHQLVPWSCDIEPAIYLNGRMVTVEVPWPDELARDNIQLHTIASHLSGDRIVIGPNSIGENIVLPSRDITHTLIGGQTGSGKSCLMRSMACQLSTRSRGPDNLLVMCDGKGGEGLMIGNGLRGQVGPIATSEPQITNALGWCVAEMNRRYEMIAASGGFQLDRDAVQHIFVIFDEFQPFTNKSASPAIAHYKNVLATQGRAAAIHLVSGTQKPLEGTFGEETTKGQYTVVIGGCVRGYNDSASIMGDYTSCLHQLLPRGDMRVKAMTPSLIRARVQAAYIPEDMIKGMTGHTFLLEEWPEVELSGIPDKRTGGRQRREITPDLAAIGIEAAVGDHGRPWFKRQFPSGNVPGTEVSIRAMDYGSDIVRMIYDRGGQIVFPQGDENS